MDRKKKIIWWERGATVTSAGEARQRGGSEGSTRRGRSDSPYYGPVTLETDDTGPESMDPAAG